MKLLSMAILSPLVVVLIASYQYRQTLGGREVDRVLAGISKRLNSVTALQKERG